MDNHTGCKCFIQGPKHHKEIQLLSLEQVEDIGMPWWTILFTKQVINPSWAQKSLLTVSNVLFYLICITLLLWSVGVYDENYCDDFMDLKTLWKLVVSHRYVLARSYAHVISNAPKQEKQAQLRNWKFVQRLSQTAGLFSWMKTIWQLSDHYVHQPNHLTRPYTLGPPPRLCHILRAHATCTEYQ